MRKSFPVHTLTLLLFLGAGAFAAGADRPNILIMMVDDLGFSDFGCYGSEIETPNIDRLASEGVRFSQFYNTAKCESSRVSLLSGLYHNQAGGRALSRAVTFAEALHEAGYATSMTGKWHLEREPTDRGFEHYWGHLSGATDFFVGDDTFRLDGKPWAEFRDGFYTTDANVDFAMRFIDDALESGRPFLHYIAFNAPHYPLQAPKQDIAKYLGRYDVGWEAVRERRFEKQKKLGLFDETEALPPLPRHVPRWADLDETRRQQEAFRMAVFAGMVDHIDQAVGRMIAFLRERGQLDNTLIMLFSDNGGCPFERSDHLEIPPWQGGSFLLYDASWATVSNTPLRHYKQTQHEGGISSPLIVRWPGVVAEPGSWIRRRGHLVDIMATCLDVAGADYPDTYGDRQIEPLQGLSLLPLLKGKTRESHDELYFQFSTCRALRHGDWKAVSFYGHRWELYNLADDRFEQHDLAQQFPDKVVELANRWQQIAREKDRPPEKFQRPVSNKPATNTHPQWHRPERLKDWKIPPL